MQTDVLCRRFLRFFSERDHRIHPSASLVPKDDASLLWINSGVAALKPYFDGRETPPHPRIVGVQKSLRTNDIENVGFTARHHTFFEMMGNFSIGDYFKKEAIEWAWDFLTSTQHGLDLPKERLHVTVHPEDHEAYEFWKGVGVASKRIYRVKENFWDLGVGPSGPNTEIFYDRGPEWGDQEGPDTDGDRFLEVWNLVFSQYNHLQDGSYIPLPRKNIDTGMGLERMAAIVQGVKTTYETDRFTPIITAMATIARVRYGEEESVNRSIRVISDHIRTLTVAMADGVLPSAEGRGYVLRRLLRRAVRYGRSLGVERAFLRDLVPVVIATLRTSYPMLTERESWIGDIITGEEERFHNTLRESLGRLTLLIETLRKRGQHTLSGEDAFCLYDTYGLPLDVTVDVLREHGLRVDEEGFSKAMAKQQERARTARGQTPSGIQVQKISNPKGGIPASRFVGYTSMNYTSRILALWKGGEPVSQLSIMEEGVVVLDATPLYAQGGGQVFDQGWLIGTKGKARVVRVLKGEQGEYQHHVQVQKGCLREGGSVQATVDATRRRDVSRNHTATHLLHRALREILGPHATQAGSDVNPDRLRFDFPHPGPLTREEQQRIEDHINAVIDADLPVQTFTDTLEEAKRHGAMALFGETYGKKVRVVQIGTDNLELCGGTHVGRTASLGSFLLVGEAGIGAGIRRIEAVTGHEARLQLFRARRELRSLEKHLQTCPGGAEQQLLAWKERMGQLEIQVRRMKKEQLEYQVIPRVLKKTRFLGDLPLLAVQLEKQVDEEQFLFLLDRLREHVSGVIVLGNVTGHRVQLLASVSEEWVERGIRADHLLRDVAQRCDGRGGGKPHMARGGGKSVDRLPDALNYVAFWLEKYRGNEGRE
ncbi:alanine--tRNA ligase [Pasteuria penetrans]|uniref:alanine--tRNA ligase n=1 Tax=Pasteuria penetrans TaxID=86005 RepID=UPI000FADF509|nr:alanine--tRNA ligase [Pasteuria penetrans]